MPLDPLTAAAVAATGKWMWDSYGKTFTDELAQKLGLAAAAASSKKRGKKPAKST